MPNGEVSCRVGVDDNLLGARLGPLVVAAVLAEVTASGQRHFARPLRGKSRQDLGDSKRLVSHSDVTVGEAWARVLIGDCPSHHEPGTSGWVEETRERRRSLQILDECFERARDTAS